MQNLSDTGKKFWATLTHPDAIRGLLVGYFRDSKDAAVKLLQSSGVAISQSAPAKEVQIAFLKAVKDSDAFRQKAAASLQNYVSGVRTRVQTAFNSKDMKNFVDEARADGYLNAVSVADQFTTLDANSYDTSADITVPAYANTQGVQLATVPGSASTYVAGSSAVPNAPAPSSSGGGFWSSLGSIFTPQVIQSGIQTGLKAISTNITAKANQTSEQNALQLEQLKLAQAQVAAQAQALKPPMSTGTKILIGVGVGAVVIGTIVFIIRKRGRKAA